MRGENVREPIVLTGLPCVRTLSQEPNEMAENGKQLDRISLPWLNPRRCPHGVTRLAHDHQMGLGQDILAD